jgi:hypothetical protein
VSEVITSTLIVEELNRLRVLIADAEARFDRAAREHANKENAYRKAKALAYLAAEGTVEKRKAMVDKDCDRERLEAYLARAEKEGAKESLASLKAQLSALQSIAATVRSEAELAGKGTW